MLRRKFHDSEIAHRYLDDLTGIEIGGSAHNPFHLSNCLNVDYTDSMDTIFKLAEFELCGEKLPVDVVAYGENLPFADGQYDYIISSHVLEHIFDPIGAMIEWLRVIKPGGYVFTIVPMKEATVENRPITTLQELIDRHEGRLRPENIKMWENQEALVRDDGLPIEYVGEILSNRETGHFTVFSLKLLVDMCNWVGGLKVVKKMEKDDKVGNGHLIICLKT
jgi:SAM-dependent methyltransferase